jgi:hypothetical protein
VYWLTTDDRDGMDEEKGAAEGRVATGLEPTGWNDGYLRLANLLLRSAVPCGLVIPVASDPIALAVLATASTMVSEADFVSSRRGFKLASRSTFPVAIQKFDQFRSD